MKKLLFLLPALLLVGILFISCQEEPTITDPGNLKLVNIENSGSGCTPIYAGQNIEVGTICLDDDWTNNELTVIYNITAPGWEITEVHFAVGDQMSDIPTTKKGNMIPGQFPFVYSFATGLTSYSFTVPFSYFGVTGCDDETIYYAAAHCAVQLVENGQVIQTETGWGNGSVHPGNNWGEIFNFKLECYGGGGDSGSETAFAYGCDDATCFLDIPNENFMRWGWTNGPLTDYGTYTFPIYAGAGQCDLTKGTLVGELIVNYDGSTAEVTFTTCGGYTMDETHLYVGCDILPMNNGEYTIAPGQFPYKHEDLPAGTNSDPYTITGLSCIDGIYVVAHAVVLGDYTDGDCGTPGCDFVPPTPPCDPTVGIVYGMERFTGDVYMIDVVTRIATLSFSSVVPPPASASPNGLAYDGVNKRMYYCDYNTGTNPRPLYFWDYTTTTEVVAGTVSYENAAADFYNGKYYYIASLPGTDDLWEVTFNPDGTILNKSKKADIALGAHGWTFNGDIAIKDGILYGWGKCNTHGYEFFTYNLTSGTFNLYTPSYQQSLQLAFGSNGDVLYGHRSGAPGNFYAIDITNGSISAPITIASGELYTDCASGYTCP